MFYISKLKFKKYQEENSETFELTQKHFKNEIIPLTNQIKKEKKVKYAVCCWFFPFV